MNSNQYEELAAQGAREERVDEVLSAEVVSPSILREVDSRPQLKWALVAVLVVVALLSALPIGAYFSSPEAYTGTIASLDEKRNVVTGLTTLAVATSTAITALPGDVGTPIAERLAELSQDFLVILTVIYLEKFLLTTFGFAAFRILIPLACLCALAAVLIVANEDMRKKLGRVAAKLFLLSIALAITVPISIAISDKMEAIHEVSLSSTLEQIEAESEGVAATVPEVEMDEQQDSTQAEDQNFFERLFSGAQETATGFAETVAGTVETGTDQAIGLLNSLTDSLALLIVTSCIIPLLVVVLLLWVVKLIMGVDVSAPMRLLVPRSVKGAGLVKHIKVD